MTSGCVGCAFCGAIVPIEDAAAGVHLCRHIDTQGPFLSKEWPGWHEQMVEAR